MSIKLIIGIVTVVIIAGALFFLWKKWNNDLKKLERSQNTLQNQFAHGVVLDPSDVASLGSEMYRGGSDAESVSQEPDNDTSAAVKQPSTPKQEVRVEASYFLSSLEKEPSMDRIEEVIDEEEAELEANADAKAELLELRATTKKDPYVLPSEQPTEPLFDEEEIVFTDIEVSASVDDVQPEDEPQPDLGLTPEPVEETKPQKVKLKIKPKKKN